MYLICISNRISSASSLRFHHPHSASVCLAPIPLHSGNDLKSSPPVARQWKDGSKWFKRVRCIKMLNLQTLGSFQLIRNSCRPFWLPSEVDLLTCAFCTCKLVFCSQAAIQLVLTSNELYSCSVSSVSVTEGTSGILRTNIKFMPSPLNGTTAPIHKCQVNDRVHLIISKPRISNSWPTTSNLQSNFQQFYVHQTNFSLQNPKRFQTSSSTSGASFTAEAWLSRDFRFSSRNLAWRCWAASIHHMITHDRL